MALLSVIMGVYDEQNREHTAQAIDSVLNQEFTDFEFIICDDGSKDEFYQWLREYCSKDERIILLRNSGNKGLAKTLNRCVNHAAGKYLARMDADDLSEKERFRKQIAFLEQHKKYALVGCNAKMIGQNGQWGKRMLPEIPEKKDFLYTSPFIHPSIIIKKDVMDRLGGYSEESQAYRTEDYELFMRLYAKGYLGYNIQEFLFSYREDQNAYQKRKYRFRINEYKVRYHGFKELGILKGHFIYVIKPLIVGLIPSAVMSVFRRKKFGV